MNEWEEQRELTAQEREIAVREGLNPGEWLSFGDNGTYLCIVKRDGSEMMYVPLKG